MNTRKGKSSSTKPGNNLTIITGFCWVLIQFFCHATGYNGATPQSHHRSASNGRAGGGSTGGISASTGVEMDLRHRDSSLPRVYEDPDELASSNQVNRKCRTCESYDSNQFTVLFL